MKQTNWKGTAELIGIAAIVGSLIFVGLQIKQDRDVARSQLYQSTLESTIGLDSAIADHADVWAKAARGETLLANEEIILGRIVNMWRLRAFYETLSLTRIGSGGRGGAIYRFAITLYENPGARRVFVEHAKKDENYLVFLTGGDAVIDFQRNVLELLEELDTLKE